jgi:O-acetyl-ADP-ribose deacetylase (regulator of RNase III)
MQDREQNVMQVTVNGISIELTQGDITDLAVDAVVNAANSELILGAGVAGAIARKGGPTIQQECYDLGDCEVGNAVITGAGNLPAKHVIHAVGPRMGEGNEPGKLAGATRSSLTLAERHKLSAIAFPAISTGVFGYPMEGCAKVMLRVIVDFTFEDLVSLKRVIVCLFDDGAYQIFADNLQQQIDELDESTLA